MDAGAGVSEAFGSPEHFLAVGGDEPQPFPGDPELTMQHIDHGIKVLWRGDALVAACQINTLHSAVTLFEDGDVGGVLAALGIPDEGELQTHTDHAKIPPSRTWLRRFPSFFMTMSTLRMDWTLLVLPDPADRSAWNDELLVDWSHVMYEFERSDLGEKMGWKS